jgi:hypothetical protein
MNTEALNNDKKVRQNVIDALSILIGYFSHPRFRWLILLLWTWCATLENLPPKKVLT